MQILRSISDCICKVIQFMGFGIKRSYAYGLYWACLAKPVVAGSLAFYFLGSLKSRRCFGCCTKTPFVTSDNKPTGSLGKSQNTNKHSILEGFSSSSTYDMDISIPQSQISASSTSNAPVDAHSNSGSNPSEFVNRGLLLWNQTRQQWIGDKSSDHDKKTRQPVISWNATYDNLLGTNKPFTRTIPLPEMVNFLMDIWEQEGLYD